MLSSSSEDSSNFFLGGLFSLDRGTLSSDSDWDDEEEEEDAILQVRLVEEGGYNGLRMNF